MNNRLLTKEQIADAAIAEKDRLELQAKQSLYQQQQLAIQDRSILVAAGQNLERQLVVSTQQYNQLYQAGHQFTLEQSKEIYDLRSLANSQALALSDANSYIAIMNRLRPQQNIAGAKVRLIDALSNLFSAINDLNSYSPNEFETAYPMIIRLINDEYMKYYNMVLKKAKDTGNFIEDPNTGQAQITWYNNPKMLQITDGRECMKLLEAAKVLETVTSVLPKPYHVKDRLALTYPGRKTAINIEEIDSVVDVANNVEQISNVVQQYAAIQDGAQGFVLVA